MRILPAGGRDPTIDDPLQGNGGTCYAIAGMASVAEKPELLTDMFLTPEKNSAGINGIRFYIRGKPWVISVDDWLLYMEDDPENDVKERLYYTLASKDGLMWAPILEKAFAKMKGNYNMAEGGV